MPFNFAIVENFYALIFLLFFVLFCQQLKTKVDVPKTLCKSGVPSVPFLPHYSNKHTFAASEKRISLLYGIHIRGTRGV
jgi:hypothetical protein